MSCSHEGLLQVLCVHLVGNQPVLSSDLTLKSILSHQFELLLNIVGDHGKITQLVHLDGRLRQEHFLLLGRGLITRLCLSISLHISCVSKMVL